MKSETRQAAKIMAESVPSCLGQSLYRGETEAREIVLAGRYPNRLSARREQYMWSMRDGTKRGRD